MLCLLAFCCCLAALASAVSRRLRRLERRPGAAVEGRTAETHQGTRAPDHGLPPAARTSKWNQIKHRLFPFISQNWRGKPRYSLTTIIGLIGATTPGTGLKVYRDRDTNDYPRTSGAPTSLAIGTTRRFQSLITLRLFRDGP